MQMSRKCQKNILCTNAMSRNITQQVQADLEAKWKRLMKICWKCKRYMLCVVANFITGRKDKLEKKVLKIR